MTYNATPKDASFRDSEVFDGKIEGFSPRARRRGPRAGDGILYFMLDFAEQHRDKDVAPGTRDFLKAMGSFFRKTREKKP